MLPSWLPPWRLITLRALIAFWAMMFWENLPAMAESEMTKTPIRSFLSSLAKRRAWKAAIQAATPPLFSQMPVP